MQLTVKTLQGAKFTLTAEPSSTVAQLKGLVAAEKSTTVDLVKLIHSGKVLKDDDTVEKCGIKETDFLVVMISKPKKSATAPAAAAPAPAAATAAAPAAPPAAASTPAPAAAPAATPAAAPAPAASPAETPVSAAAVTELMNMGFPEDQCRAALSAASGNPQLAVEFLFSGLPDQPVAAPTPAAAAPAAMAPAPAASAPAASGGPLSRLRSHPQFAQLRTLVQSNPAALQQVLQTIGAQVRMGIFHKHPRSVA